jgi:hypothetical protein
MLLKASCALSGRQVRNGATILQGRDRRARGVGFCATDTAEHPDVISLKQEIANIPAETGGAKSGVAQNVGGQSEALMSEIAMLRERNKKLHSEIPAYQDRVSNTPIRAIELSKITRNYDITLKKFQELLSKSFDSQLSENMEKKQKGEQFQVVDRPMAPEKPVAPNRLLILLVGLLLGLAGGCGVHLCSIGWASFKNNDDLASFSGYCSRFFQLLQRETIRSERKVRAILVLASLGTVVGRIFD